MTTRQVTFPARGGEHAPLLRGRVREPEPPRAGAAVLCHPHPAFGGSMDVWLLPTIGQRLTAAGWLTLRFDFRGVPSREASSNGRDERADLAGALTFLRTRYGETGRLALVGWSFGALIALLEGMADPDITDWIGIAPPTAELPSQPMPPLPAAIDRWPARRVVIVGEYDQFFPPDNAHLLAPHELHVIEGADHFLFDRDREVADLVVTSLGQDGHAA